MQIIDCCVYSQKWAISEPERSEASAEGTRDGLSILMATSFAINKSNLHSVSISINSFEPWINECNNWVSISRV